MKPSRTDWKHLRKAKDKDIRCTDIPPLTDEFFVKAQLRLPRPKSAVSLRLDPEVLDWFKKQGRGYQTRINAVLRLYMETHARRTVKA